MFEEKYVRYVIYQKEIAPETKAPHWQMYVEFFDCVRMPAVKKAVGPAHVEPRKGTRTQAREYCRKVETAVAGTQFEWGLWREEANRKRKLEDLLLTDMSLNDLIDVSPQWYVRYHRGLEKLYARRIAKKARQFRTVTVEVLVGGTGTGKTRRATEGEDWFIMPCSERLWMDGYNEEKTLIIDDFYGNIKYMRLLRMLDGHPLQLPVKGGFIWARWTKVIITSNVEPSEWYSKLFPAGTSPALQRRITSVVHMPPVPVVVDNVELVVNVE